MKVKFSISSKCLQDEQKYFLFRTNLGRFLASSLIIVLSIIFFVLIEGFDSLGRVDFFHIIGRFASTLMVVTLLCGVGYLYMNSGGHVSNYFETNMIRVLSLDLQKKVLLVEEGGVVHKFQFSDLKLEKSSLGMLVRSTVKVFLLRKQSVLEGDLDAFCSELEGALVGA